MTSWLMRLMGATALLVVSLGFAACSGGDPATDEDFVQELCEATSQLDQQFAAAVAKASEQTDPNKAVEALVGPLEEFVRAFEDADPPKDLEDWHHSASKQLEDAVAKFKKEKALASLEGFGDSPVPDPPADAKARLREAGKKVAACDGVAFLKP